MAIVYSKADDDLRNSVKMKIRDTPAFAGGGPGDLNAIVGKNFPFQFPPRVTNDGKSADWEEKSRVSYEPVAYWMGAKAREIQITATYFVTGEKKWSGAEIAKIAAAAKAYFYRSIEESVTKKGFGPVVEITSLYGAIQEESTWRMSAVNVEYAETFVRDDTSPIPGNKTDLKIDLGFLGDIDLGSIPPQTREVPKVPLWPLWTKITFDLLSWTQNANAGGKEKLKTDSLVKAPTPKWY